MRCVVLLPLLAALSACSPILRTHGNVVDDVRLSQIQPGISRQADVAALLGTPSAEGTFNPNEWYYVGQTTSKTAFFAPEVIDRQIVKVVFEPSTGTVASIERLSKADGQKVALVERTTPTAGHNLGVVEQILGNVGRFNPPKQD